MAEIKIRITELDNAIERLRALQTRCDSMNTNPHSTVGGGKTVNELEAIAEVYKLLNGHFGILISNTISFLENVKDSYVSSDSKAASKIKGGRS